MDWLGLVLRWFHIMAAITAVGGTIFMRYALVPSIGVLGDEQRKRLHDQVRSRWAKLVAASVAVLLISGIINFVLFIRASKTWGEDWRSSYLTLYHMVFGIKFVLASLIFFFASALAGRGEATKAIRMNAKRWMTVNVVLALTVVALSGVLRLTHVGPSPTPSQNAPSTVGLTEYFGGHDG